jgi:ABC-type transport system substrate-binding protein
VDEWLEQARMSTDQKQRQAMYYQVQEQINADLPVGPMFWRPNPLVAHAKFGNVQPSVIHTYGGVHNWCVKE